MGRIIHDPGASGQKCANNDVADNDHDVWDSVAGEIEFQSLNLNALQKKLMVFAPNANFFV